MTDDQLEAILAAFRRLPQRRRALPSQASYGIQVALQPNGPPQTPVNSPDTGDGERDYVVTWAASSLPPGFGGIAPSATCGVIQVTIDYSQAESNYQLGPFDVVNLQQQTIDICARRVTVSAQWSGYTAGASPSAILFKASIGLTDTTHPPTLPVPATWYRSPAVLYGALGGSALVSAANPQVLVPSSGSFQGCTGNVTTATGTVYVMLFDEAATSAAPAAGALPLWCTDALVAGQGFSSIDVSGKTAWSYGLWAGLSSTPGSYTPVNGRFSLDVLGG